MKKRYFIAVLLLLIASICLLGACGGVNDHKDSTYTVKFVTNAEGITLDDQIVKENSKVEIPPQIERDGYVFKGWYVDAQFENEYDFDKEVTSDLTLYARWDKAKEVTITFDAGIYGEDPEPIKVRVGEKIGKLPVPQTPGYRFIGWSYDEDTVDRMADENTIVSSENDFTLYAVCLYGDAYLTFDYGDRAEAKSDYFRTGESLNLDFYFAVDDDEMIISHFLDEEGNEHYRNENYVVSGPQHFTAVYVQPVYELELDYDNNSWIILGLDSRAEEKDLNIPDILYGIPVGEIAERAFANTDITSAVLPDSLRLVGDAIFAGCKNLRSISLPYVGENRTTEYGDSSLVAWYFGDEEFEGCVTKTQVRCGTTIHDGNVQYVYKTVYFPEVLDTVEIRGGAVHYFCAEAINAKHIKLGAGVNEIRHYAFRGSDIETITFTDNSVNLIGDFAFSRCASLQAVALPEGLTLIGRGAFANCSEMKTMTMPDSVTSTGGEVFANCFALTSARLSDKLDGISYNMFINDGSLVEVNIPSAIAFVGDSAFEDVECPEFNLPETVTQLGARAFAYNSSLKEITIPAGVNYIGERIFWNCKSLANVTFKGTEIQSFPAYAFASTGITSIDIPSSVKSIGLCAFERAALETINIPDNVTALGEYAFQFCQSLTTVTFGAGVTIQKLPNFLFYNCTSLCNIEIPSSVTTFGSSVFTSCSSLRLIIVPSTVTTIEGDCFFGSPYVLILSPEASKPTGWAENWNEGEYTTIFVGSEIMKNDEWVYTLNKDNNSEATLLAHVYGKADVTVPDNINGKKIVEIGVGAFEYDYALKNLIISEGITTIDEKAFKDCRYVEEIKLPESLTTIQDEAFNSCWKLGKLNLPVAVESIGADAFRSDSRLIIYTLASEATKKNTWNANKALNSVTIVWDTDPDSIKAEGMFSYLEVDGHIKIERVSSEVTGIIEIPSVIEGKSVTEIGDKAFSASYADVIYIPSSVTIFGTRCFSMGQGCLAFEAESAPAGFTPGCYNENSLTILYGCAKPQIDKQTSLVYVAYKSGYENVTQKVAPSDSGNICIVGIDDETVADAVIPENIDGKTVNMIASGSFYYNKDVLTVQIPKTMEYIGYWAFYNINAGLIIYNNATEENRNNFQKSWIIGSTQYYNVEVKQNDTFQYIIENGKITITHYIGDDVILEFPAEIDGIIIDKIGDRAFGVDVENKNCPAYKVRIIHFAAESQLTAIGAYAFYNCEMLFKVYIIPKTVTTIGNSAFGYAGGAMRYSETRNPEQPFVVLVFEESIVGNPNNYAKGYYAYGASNRLTADDNGEVNETKFWEWFEAYGPRIEEEEPQPENPEEDKGGEEEDGDGDEEKDAGDDSDQGNGNLDSGIGSGGSSEGD